jgi:tRNA nucleotidyltransferase (CCA-adding enzyme)
MKKEVADIIELLEKAGFLAYAVGGCVRDFLLKKEPQDWDITTNASPEQIQEVLKEYKTFYENKFFTVGVVMPDQIIEVTTFRSEGRYLDGRHPEEVKPVSSLEEDLQRRDFTVNAMAMDRQKKIIDPFEGQKDLKKKVLRTVGKADERFNEDALRLLRGVRLAVRLGFTLSPETEESIKKNYSLLKNISQERIRDELTKIIMTDQAAEGIEKLRQLGLLKYILPEVEEGYGVAQNKHHIYDCYEHNLFSLKYAAKKNFSLEVRLAALLHDVAKPCCKRGEGEDASFHGHEVVGARMTKKILERLRYPRQMIEKIVKLVRFHLFYYNVGEVTETSVRRLVRQVGTEDMEDLLQLRMCDRIGSGVPKAEPYKLRHLRYLIEKVSLDPISAKMLKINGQDLMKLLDIHPGPKVGQILNILLDEVLNDPKLNKSEFLEKRAKELNGLSDKEREKLSFSAKQEKEKLEMKKDEMTKKKYWVT